MAAQPAAGFCHVALCATTCSHVLAALADGLGQAVFGDGLTSVSLFMEPDAGTPRRETPLSWGVTQALSRRIGNAWVTVVGDVPLVTLQFFSNQLERRQP